MCSTYYLCSSHTVLLLFYSATAGFSRLTLPFSISKSYLGGMIIEEALRSETAPKVYEGVTVTQSLFSSEAKYDLQQMDKSADNRFAWRVHVFHYPEGVMSTFRKQFGNDAETVGTLNARLTAWLATYAPHLKPDLVSHCVWSNVSSTETWERV
eukprot:3476422-Rhodomonas_salina.2